ncbi:MAG: type II secretion system secretin GspD, partial [Rhodospirillales bacterium]|nr:type II secretion system secretin GspD [Rhodospirillales bacterium]
DAVTDSVPVRVGRIPADVPQTDDMITQIIPMRFADAEQVARDIRDLVPDYAELTANESSNSVIITDTSANVRRIMEVVTSLDTTLAGVADVRVFRLEYADASDTARLINDIFVEERRSRDPREEMMRRWMEARTGSSRGRGGDSRGSSSRNSGESRQVSATLKASADDRTNTVVVTGSPEMLDLIATVIDELDENPTSQEDVFIHFVRNGEASNLADILNNLFSTSGTTRGGGSSSSRFSGGSFQRGGNVEQEGAMALVGNVDVVPDADTNSILVLTSTRNIPMVKKIIEQLDKPAPQVLIKVLVAEVTHDDALDVGAEWSVLGDDGASIGVGTDFGLGSLTSGFVFRVLEEDLTVTIRALEENGKLEVLSRPYILASDNQQASITIGNQVPFITNTRTTETGQTINTIEYRDIGIILEVTPQINPDGIATMDVTPTLSAITGDTVPISETVDAVVYANRSASSRVALRDGQTVVIGGLMEDRLIETISKVPIIGSIPILGELFKRTEKQKSKTELLFFLTPHVAEDWDELDKISNIEKKGSDLTPDAIEEGVYDRQLRMMEGRGNMNEIGRYLEEAREENRREELRKLFEAQQIERDATDE